MKSKISRGGKKRGYFRRFKLEEVSNQLIRNPRGKNEEKMTGLVFKLEGEFRCALTGRIDDRRSVIICRARWSQEGLL